MKQFLFFCLVAFHVCTATVEDPPIPENVDLLSEVLAAYPRLSLAEAKQYIELLHQHLQYLNTTYPSSPRAPVPFTCSTYGPSPTPPESAHSLRPADVKVVMAIGDSITAAFGAKAKYIWDVFTEYRGVSWSIGGDGTVENVITMPNILREYNSALKGYSIKTGKASSSNADLNQAVTGAKAADLLPQAKALLSRMEEDSDINIAQDWKVLTLWIGGNDLCDYCSDKTKYSPEEYQKHVRETLRFLKENVPRLFVNLVLAIDVTKLHEVSSGLCSFLHSYECSCGTSSDAKVRAEVSMMATEYNNKLVQLRDEEEFNDKEDFTVVIQPFYIETQVPRDSNDKPDLDYFAPDCFHFSFLGHEAAAVALWNNMVEPVGHKRTSWTIGEPIECPPSDGTFFTNNNS